MQDLWKVGRDEVGGGREGEGKLKFGLVEVVWEWARGMVCTFSFSSFFLSITYAHAKPFEQIMNLTDIAEGTIVRTITRLDETCREVRDAARVIGDAELFKKMEEAQGLIRRDSECLSFRCGWLRCLCGRSCVCC